MTIKELKEKSGMSLKEFAEYFGIPYRTMQNWVAGNTQCADYIVRMMHYKLCMENKIQKKDE